MDSLILNDLYELIGGTTDSWVQLKNGYVIGEPTPDVATYVGILLDGDQVTGSRSGNRTISLPLDVFGTTRVDLAANVNKLVEIIDSGVFTLTWTPNAGLPVVFDCYRGAFQRVRNDVLEQQYMTTVNLTFQAAPFGRSPAPLTISASSSSLSVDGMETAPTGATADAVIFYAGTKSAKGSMARTGGLVGSTGVGLYLYTLTTITRTIASTNLSTYSSIGFRFRWAAPAAYYNWTVALTLALSDGANSDTVTKYITVAPGATGWKLVTFDLSDFSGPNLAAVTSWTITGVTAANYTVGTPAATVNPNVDDLRALPPSSPTTSTAQGAVFTVPSVKGTARAPMSLTVSRGGSAMTNGFLVHRPPVGQSLDAVTLAAFSGSAPWTVTGHSGVGLEGTYVIACAQGTAGSGTRTVTMTVTQKNSGTTVATDSVSAIVVGTPVGKFILLGQLTLPLARIPDENTSVTYDFSLASSGGTAGTYTDLMLLDSKGQFVVVPGTLTSIINAYIDAPEPSADITPIYVSTSDRTLATVLTANPERSSGGPMMLEPGDNRLLALCPDGLPTVTASYFPRWLDERTV